MRRVFSTRKFDLIRVSQYLMNGLKGGCKGLEYSKTPKKPLSSSTGMTPETLIYHNACNYDDNILQSERQGGKKGANKCGTSCIYIIRVSHLRPRVPKPMGIDLPGHAHPRCRCQCDRGH